MNDNPIENLKPITATVAKIDLPKPCMPPPADGPHVDWPRFIQALWEWGALHPDPVLVEQHLDTALLKNLRNAFAERTDAPTVRPSSYLSCARQSYLLLQGHEPEPMPRDISLTFAMGHLVEAGGRAYLEGALPPGFALKLNQRVPLPSWWPVHERFAKQGTNDFYIEVTGPEADAYLSPRAPRRCMGDFKTSSSFQFDAMRRVASLGEKPDAFGYQAQVAVYADGHGDDCDAVLAVFNRNSPGQGLAVRRLDAGVRQFEKFRVMQAVTGAVAGHDPGREFQRRWGKGSDFYCKRVGGYCGLRKACAETPEPAAPAQEVIAV